MKVDGGMVTIRGMVTIGRESHLSDAQTDSDDREHVRESFSKGRTVETGWHFQWHVRYAFLKGRTAETGCVYGHVRDSFPKDEASPIGGTVQTWAT
jgi:hypothetical protein